LYVKRVYEVTRKEARSRGYPCEAVQINNRLPSGVPFALPAIRVALKKAKLDGKALKKLCAEKGDLSCARLVEKLHSTIRSTPASAYCVTAQLAASATS
jgi:hypothetical protein